VGGWLAKRWERSAELVLEVVSLCMMVGKIIQTPTLAN